MPGENSTGEYPLHLLYIYRTNMTTLDPPFSLYPLFISHTSYLSSFLSAMNKPGCRLCPWQNMTSHVWSYNKCYLFSNLHAAPHPSAPVSASCSQHPLLASAFLSTVLFQPFVPTFRANHEPLLVYSTINNAHPYLSPHFLTNSLRC